MLLIYCEDLLLGSASDGTCCGMVKTLSYLLYSSSGEPSPSSSHSLGDTAARRCPSAHKPRPSTSRLIRRPRSAAPAAVSLSRHATWGNALTYLRPAAHAAAARCPVPTCPLKAQAMFSHHMCHRRVPTCARSLPLSGRSDCHRITGTQHTQHTALRASPLPRRPSAPSLYSHAQSSMSFVCANGPGHAAGGLSGVLDES